ncbi:MAG: hypothetical protein ACOYO1_01125 [Bacteroidales bacterium]
MNKSIIIYLLFFLFVFFINPKAYSQLYGFQVSTIEPKGDFGKTFSTSYSLDAFSLDIEFDDHLRFGSVLGVTFLNAKKDTFLFGSYGRRVFDRSYELQIGLFMNYNFLKEDFSPFIGFDLNVMFVKYNYTVISKNYNDVERKNDFGICILPKIGVSYEYKEDFVISVGGAYAYRYKIIEGKKESFIKYFISIAYSF